MDRTAVRAVAGGNEARHRQAPFRSVPVTTTGSTPQTSHVWVDSTTACVPPGAALKRPSVPDIHVVAVNMSNIARSIELLVRPRKNRRPSTSSRRREPYVPSARRDYALTGSVDSLIHWYRGIGARPNHGRKPSHSGKLLQNVQLCLVLQAQPITKSEYQARFVSQEWTLNARAAFTKRHQLSLLVVTLASIAEIAEDLLWAQRFTQNFGQVSTIATNRSRA